MCAVSIVVPPLELYEHLPSWVEISVDDILKYLSYFSQKIGDNLHEMSEPIFWKKYKIGDNLHEM